MSEHDASLSAAQDVHKPPTSEHDASPSPLLLARGLTVRYGGVYALRAVDLEIPKSQIVGLIGPNGAGKTTLINAITGVVGPDAGEIRLANRRIDRVAHHRIARLGIARTYQNIRLFGTLSVWENVSAGVFARPRPFAAADAVALLERVGMGDRNLQHRAGALPYGEQRRLEIARALAMRPALLLLDEPAAGMNPRETVDLARVIRTIAADGTAVLLVEHDMTLVRAICDFVYVLNFGEVIARGVSEAVMSDPTVVEAYLGTQRAAG
ncbi:MAG: ABC transporter ATP-binding protein [Vulcanimicrobiaceae bacterium]